MPASIAQQIQEGLAHHSAGRLEEAAAVYRRILEQDRNCPGAIHLLGVVYAQQKKFKEGIPLIRRAIELSPNEAAFHSNLAQLYIESGSPDEALLAARRAVQLDPKDAAALNHLGNALRQLRRFDESVETLRRAVRMREGHTEAMTNLALALRESGQASESLAVLDRMAQVKPNDPNANFFRAAVFQSQKLYPQAIALFEKCIAANVEVLQSWLNIGVMHYEMGDCDQAISDAKKAIAIDPTQTGPYNNLGLALTTIGRIDEAIEALEEAIRLRPDNADAWNNLGNAHLQHLEVAKALDCYDKALYAQPDNVHGHWNRSLSWLLTERWYDGWLEYEWRWQQFRDVRRTLAAPKWEGGSLKGKSILLHAEQGFGDTIQFVRFARNVAAQASEVHLECSPLLVSLMKTVDGLASVTARGEPLPSFDLHCPLLSLPYALRLNSTDAFRIEGPYIHANAQGRAKWASKLGATHRKRIGITWAGAKIHPSDRSRSLSLERFAPLFERQDMQFVSLQKVIPQADQGEIARLGLIDHTSELQTFSDTADLMANLDLVISVDTAVAHLAGALGKPVWILLPYRPDWRWLLGRDDSPWYPSARLFRQTIRDDWDGVIERVAAELKSI